MDSFSKLTDTFDQLGVNKRAMGFNLAKSKVVLIKETVSNKNKL